MSFLKDLFVGKKIFQPVFERMFRISLRGMNYGLGGIISTSGEINLIKTIHSKLNNLGVDNKIIFDIGANDGQYTNILTREFSNEDEVHCFEPSKFSFKALHKRFNLLNNVKLVNQGLGSSIEQRTLFYDLEGSGWASVFERKDTGFNHHLSNSEEISIITLDEYCKKNNIKNIHFLKADVEGFELEIFKGAKEILPNIDFIQFEFSFANFNSKTYLFDFFEILSDFKIYRVLKDGIHEIQYDPRYEVLMTSNYLAVNNKILL
jgi:FkbM family methyltransferase